MRYQEIVKKEFDESIQHFKADISTLRTGRVSPSLVENVSVEAYGSHSPLMQVASISAPEPRVIAIQPWDKSLMKDIEQALQKSDLNLQPVVDRDIIRLNFPSLTEEKRKELVKTLHQKAELAKVGIKQKREKIREQVSTDEKAGTVTQDEKFKSLDAIDKVVKEYHDQIHKIIEAKEKEILTI